MSVLALIADSCIYIVTEFSTSRTMSFQHGRCTLLLIASEDMLHIGGWNPISRARVGRQVRVPLFNEQHLFIVRDEQFWTRKTRTAQARLNADQLSAPERRMVKERRRAGLT